MGCISHPQFPYACVGYNWIHALFKLQLAVHTAYSSVIKSIPRPLECKFFCNNSYFSFLYAANRLIYCFPWNQCLRLTRDYILYKRIKEILTKSACSKNSVLKTFLLSSHVLSKNPQTMWAIAPTISPFNLDFPNIALFQLIYFLFALQIHDMHC